MEIFSLEGWYFILRWFHFLVGITWIGILYYFNFIQTPFFATAEAPVKSAMIRGLVPNALWWFRWGAMFTFLTGWTIVLLKMHQAAGVAPRLVFGPEAERRRDGGDGPDHCDPEPAHGLGVDRRQEQRSRQAAG